MNDFLSFIGLATCFVGAFGIFIGIIELSERMFRKRKDQAQTIKTLQEQYDILKTEHSKLENLIWTHITLGNGQSSPE